MATEREQAWLRLHLTRGLGRLGLFHLLARFGTPEAALHAGPGAWPETLGRRRSATLFLPPADDPAFLSARARFDACGARIISFWDADYPALLKTIHDPPALLYLRGSLPPDDALAVVGSRSASPAGIELTFAICRDLAATGVTIVSGLARGIDSAAHQAALDAGGSTVAVLGCGIDRVYPRENGKLFLQIVEQGAILSEYPPGTEPLPGHFPGRNRIISGLARGVLIVEAARGSGSLITADFALDQGREVFAIPGAVCAANSDGVNRLLKDGAHLVTEARDISDVLWPGLPADRTAPVETAAFALSETEAKIIAQLAADPLHIDELARKSGLTPMELSAILLQLELRGGVVQLPGMRYIRSHQTLRTAT